MRCYHPFFFLGAALFHEVNWSFLHSWIIWARHAVYSPLVFTPSSLGHFFINCCNGSGAVNHPVWNEWGWTKQPAGWRVFTLIAMAVGRLRHSMGRQRQEVGPNVHVKLSSGHMPSVSGWVILAGESGGGWPRVKVSDLGIFLNVIRAYWYFDFHQVLRQLLSLLSL